MRYTEYKEQMEAALDAVDWKNPRDKNGPGYRLLAKAAADKTLTLDEWQALHDLYYRGTESV